MCRFFTVFFRFARERRLLLLFLVNDLLYAVFLPTSGRGWGWARILARLDDELINGSILVDLPPLRRAGAPPPRTRSAYDCKSEPTPLPPAFIQPGYNTLSHVFACCIHRRLAILQQPPHKLISPLPMMLTVAAMGVRKWRNLHCALGFRTHYNRYIYIIEPYFPTNACRCLYSKIHLS